MAAAALRVLSGHLHTRRMRRPLSPVIVYAVVDETLSPTSPSGGAADVFVRLEEDAERFVDEVRRDEPELASYLRIEEQGLDAGGRN